jgi:hypothetical protein
MLEGKHPMLTGTKKMHAKIQALQTCDSTIRRLLRVHISFNLT